MAAPEQLTDNVFRLGLFFCEVNLVQSNLDGGRVVLLLLLLGLLEAGHELRVALVVGRGVGAEHLNAVRGCDPEMQVSYTPAKSSPGF